MSTQAKAVLMFSGGIGSWAAARRVPGAKTLLFADTRTEHESTYRFVFDASEDVGGRLQIIADGRDVWQVFRDSRFIGNTRADVCSRVLKRDLMRRWLEDNCDPADTTVYLGFDWSEQHRFERAKPHWAPWTVEAPLCKEPFEFKEDHLRHARERGLALPVLYDYGFAHGNCSGFCVKAGHGQFKRLLEKMPDVYAHHEAEEEKTRQYLGKDIAILRDRTGGTTTPLTLRHFRERIETDDTSQLDLLDWGASCSCMEPAS